MSPRDLVPVLLLGALVGGFGPADGVRALQRSHATGQRAPGVGGAKGARADTLPTPVLLVPGWSDPEAQLAPLQARFIRAGWRPGRVAPMGFEDPVGSNREHAEEVAEEARALRAATGADRIDIVAHSMGGLAVRHHLAATGGEGIRRVVFLATPHRGTVAAHLAWGVGGDEMEPGSPFLDSLNLAAPVPERVRALSVRTMVDLRVVPGTSAVLPEAPHVRNVEICCPTHAGLIDDPETFRVVAEFLKGEDVGSSLRSEAGRTRKGARR